jgi:hypothetical protein
LKPGRPVCTRTITTASLWPSPLLRIINDILDFSKIELGRLDMESAQFNVEAVLDNVASLVT